LAESKTKVIKGELVLLLGEESILTRADGKLHTRFGVLDLEKELEWGEEVKTHIGKSFRVAKPYLVDFLMKRGIKRKTQVLYPKDLSLILAYTTPPPDALIVDCGLGSGFSSMFLAHYCPQGKIVAYERDRENIKLALENIKKWGFENIEIKERDIFEGVDERDADLFILDMKGAEDAVKIAKESLKIGGWLAVCSPYVEQMMACVERMRELGFLEMKTVENLVREWDVRKFGHTLPQRWGNIHTVFITIGRRG